MGIRWSSLASVALATAGMLSAPASAQERLPEIQVISNTPMQGSGIDKDKIPSLTSTVTSEDLMTSLRSTPRISTAASTVSTAVPVKRSRVGAAFRGRHG